MSMIIDNPTAITVYQILVIKQALKLLHRGIKPNRAYTITATLAAASRFTGHSYTKSRKACLVAIDDIEGKLRDMGIGLTKAPHENVI